MLIFSDKNAPFLPNKAFRPLIVILGIDYDRVTKIKAFNSDLSVRYFPNTHLFEKKVVEH